MVIHVVTDPFNNDTLFFFYMGSVFYDRESGGGLRPRVAAK